MTRITQPKDAWIETYSGKQFYPFAPTYDMFDFEDIARALSCQARFNGHTREFYSVAEHSVYMADYALNELGNPDLAWACLLHDGAEAYVGDMVQPIKQFMPQFQTLIEGVERALYTAFDVDMEEYAEHVHVLDMRILKTERAQLMPQTGTHWAILDGVAPLPCHITCLSPAQAYRHFQQTARIIREAKSL